MSITARAAASAAALVVAAGALFATSPASATNTTSTTTAGTTLTVSSPIQAGPDATTIGQATFIRTKASDGTTTVVVRGLVPDGMSESHLCFDTAPYTSRQSPGSCQLAQEKLSGDVVEYTVTFPASDAERTLYFQLHVVSRATTAYAGWQPGSPFFGNVAVAAPGGGTPLPMGSLGGITLATVAAIALWAATRRRRVVARQFARN